MPAEPIEENGARIVVGRPSSPRRLFRGGFDQLGRLRLVAAPGREDHRAVHGRRVAGRLGDQACFVHHLRGRGQLAGQNVIPRDEAEREMQLPVCARVACDLKLTGLEEIQRLVVPQFQGDDVSVPRTGEREPPAAILVG